MKINLERTVIFHDQEVEIFFGKDENEVIKFIDFVGCCCPECSEPHVLQRFVPIPDDVLEEMLEIENESDEDDEYFCDDHKFDLSECTGCPNYDKCISDMIKNTPNNE